MRYKHGNINKEYFAIELGRKSGKISCILENTISKSDTNLISNVNTMLDNYSLTNRIRWFKENLPQAYKKGYREIYLSRVEILDSFSIH